MYLCHCILQISHYTSSVKPERCRTFATHGSHIKIFDKLLSVCKFFLNAFMNNSEESYAASYI